MAAVAQLCSFCKEEILDSNKTWGYHQSYDHLGKCASSCDICSRLHKDVIDYAGSLDRGTQTHRWTLRKSAKVREGKDLVTLTFRFLSEADSLTADYPVRIFYLIPENDLEHIPTAAALGSSTFSEPTLLQIEKWVHDCDDNHPRCSPVQKRRETQQNVDEDQYRAPFVPTRLLDIGSRPGDPVKLTENSLNRIRMKYTTLSYRWGEDPKFWFQLEEKKNKEHFMLNIEWDELPATFQQAIEMTRRLGVNYIWIDSLCIVQDNGEFQKEGQLMHHVYTNSFCNLSAVVSENSYGGLERRRIAESLIPLAIHSSTSQLLGNKVWRIFPADLWNGLLQEPLYKRGWVFQERMLSPRLIHFSSSQVFWDCASLSACETLPALPQPLDSLAITDREWRERLQYSAGSRYSTPLAGSSDVSLERAWYSAVQNYTKCSLTRPQNDKLNAIWGIAKLVRDLLEEKYAVGLWEKNLHEQLPWKVVDYKRAKRLDKILEKDVPSWSWASITDSEIHICDRLTSPDNRYMYVTDHSGEKQIQFDLSENVFTLHGPTPRTWKEQLDLWDEQLRRSSLVPHPQNKPHDVRTRQFTLLPTDFQPELQNTSIAIKGQVTAIALVEQSGLWRVKVNDTQLDDLEFFPDQNPSTIQPSQFAVVLAATLTRSHTRPRKNEYNGVGLVLSHLGGRQFKRIGALEFKVMSQDTWDHLSRTSYQELGLSVPDTASDPLDFWLE